MPTYERATPGYVKVTLQMLLVGLLNCQTNGQFLRTKVILMAFLLIDCQRQFHCQVLVIIHMHGVSAFERT